MGCYVNRFKIKIDSVSSAGSSFYCDLSPDIVKDTQIEFEGPIAVNVVARKVDLDIIVEGSIKAKVFFDCDRCLERFEEVVEKDNYFAYFKSPSHENIDLTEGIREDIIVSLPVKRLCNSGCLGLCKNCGKNLNSGDCGCDKGNFNIHFLDLNKLI